MQPIQIFLIHCVSGPWLTPLASWTPFSMSTISFFYRESKIRHRIPPWSSTDAKYRVWMADFLSLAAVVSCPQNNLHWQLHLKFTQANKKINVFLTDTLLDGSASQDPWLVARWGLQIHFCRGGISFPQPDEPQSVLLPGIILCQMQDSIVTFIKLEVFPFPTASTTSAQEAKVWSLALSA